MGLSKAILLAALLLMSILAITFIVLYVMKDESTTPLEFAQQFIPNQLINYFNPSMINNKKGHELFDHVYYTNLDSRQDRRYEIESELQRIGFPTNKITRNPGVLSKFGALGCSLAILNALLKFEADTNVKIALFVEDDLLFNGSSIEINDKLIKFMNLSLDWDILLLASNTIQFEPTNVEFLIKIIDAQTTAAFAVNRKFLPLLIQNVKEGIEKLSMNNTIDGLYCIDMYWKTLQKNNQWFTFYPPLAFQRDGFSDIENKLTSYNDKNLLEFQPKKVEFLICIKTCLPRLHKNKKQLEVLTELCAKYPIDFFYYYGIPDQTEKFIYLQNEKILTIQNGDSYLDLCEKLFGMITFVSQFYNSSDLLQQNLKGCFLTDDDIEILPENFYQFLKENQEINYYGKTAIYDLKLNLSNHIIDKCKISPYLKSIVQKKYPELEYLPIAVPKVTFTAGGGTFLSIFSILKLAHLEKFFPPFPNPTNFKFHVSKNKSYIENLAVFDDTQIALALQSVKIYAETKDISSIVFWE